MLNFGMANQLKLNVYFILQFFETGNIRFPYQYMYIYLSLGEMFSSGFRMFFERGRQSRVDLGDSVSDWARTSLGVPQGNVLGPLLFSIYVDVHFCSSHYIIIPLLLFILFLIFIFLQFYIFYHHSSRC